MEYVFSLPLDDFNLSKLTPFPGAPLYADIREHGEFEENWEKMNALNFIFIPKGLTKDRLDDLHWEFYRRYFTRPRMLLTYLRLGWESPYSWKRFWLNLPSFIRFAKRHEQ